MAHHAEPMDIDDEVGFDNKENTYQHSNVLPRTPCTEKGYEELDVSELNMKLRYSITPGSSPMSKSISHCLDNRQNNVTDESLNNTVVNENENNLTRSLNSTLNKTEVMSSKVLPLQVLPIDVDGNRSSVLQPLGSANTNDITITVSNENEIDNISFASSSSSMAHTPEATTPTKEIPKHDGGSPIMRGLKSVLSMFRSSQSPIPPEEEDPKNSHIVSPADVTLPESKPRAIASTPKSENTKEKSLSRRSSPHKESIVFNEDLEKELQWNDDSTIVFSTEKIPIHKLFFQDKPSKSTIVNESAAHEDVNNSTVEYMDVSYNDLSIKDRTLNGTINISKVNEMPESDGEFVDCETTFTQNDVSSKAEEVDATKTDGNLILNAPEPELSESVKTVKVPFTLDTTKDIINSIDASNIIVDDHEKPIDFSTTDIVNQLSDLINESETSAGNVIPVENNDAEILDKHETLELSNVPATTDNQPELLENKATSPDNIVASSPPAFTDPVSVENKDLVHTSGIVCHTIVPHLVSVEPKDSLVSDSVDAVRTLEISPQILLSESFAEAKTTEALVTNVNAVDYPSPVDIPLPNDDDINEIIDNINENVCAHVQNSITLNTSTSQSVLMAALDKSITETSLDIQDTKDKTEKDNITCPPSLLPSDVPLPSEDKEELVNTNNDPHEAITAVFDPVQSPAVENSKITVSDVSTPKVDSNNANVNIPITETTADISNAVEAGTIEADIAFVPTSSSDIVVSRINERNVSENVPIQAATVVTELVQQCVTENPVEVSEDNNTKEDTIFKTCIVETAENVTVATEENIADVAIVNNMPTNVAKPEEEYMEISFVELNNDKLSETMTMDVSMADANMKIADNVSQPEVSQKETSLLNIKPELPPLANDNVEPVLTDSVNIENLNPNEEQKQIFKSPKIDADNKHDENVNKELVLENASSATDKDSNIQEKADCEKSTSTDVVIANFGTNAADENMMPPEGVLGNDNILHAASMVDDTVTLGEQSLNKPLLTRDSNEKELGEVNDVNVLQDPPKGSNITVNLDSTHNADIMQNCTEKVDEEIIVSESNSPFVSMSAEEEFEPQSKRDDFEKVENPFSTKSKVAQSPPLSPKIVSKGYNLNFDDIDGINPFATKTKIRMSPPPGASPNSSTDNLNKTEVVEPKKNEKDSNRRKSMPERKKPLRAKRHLNSSVDSTEKASLKPSPSKNDDVKIASETKSEISITDSCNVSGTEKDKTPSNSSKQDDVEIASEIKFEINQPNFGSAPEEAVNKKQEAMPGEGHPEGISVNAEAEINIAQNIKVKDDVVMTVSDKSPVNPDTSSSEQSSYFLAGASSIELTNSKNVFNLPELDDLNPFVTKSKIRQSPTRDFDMDNPFATKSKITSSSETSVIATKSDFNSTVTIENEEDANLKDCSGSSKTSDEKDVTVQEVHTEDEDTVEGPFLEADEGSDDKIPELPDDKVDVVDFDNLNQQENDEMFIDAEAFEFLMNQNKTDEVAYSGKESLFLKFDPLFARRVTSEGVAFNDVKRKQNTPKKAPKLSPKEVELLSFDKPVASGSKSSPEAQSVVEERCDDINVTAPKPMMAVTPAVNPVVTPRKSLTPNKTNRLSMTFTSPAMAVIDRLLSLSGNSPSVGLDTTVTHADRTHNETDQALTQLRELLAEKEIHVYNLRCETKELKDRLTILESQMKTLETECAERLKKVNELNENLAEKTKINKNMATVVEEYERTIASLISETEQDKKRFAEERNMLIRERDEQTAHLASMEVSFNDLHSKYEKSKQVIMGYKTNEEAYMKSIQEFEENLKKMHTNYELLKQHATSKLNHANQELEKINKGHEAEILKFNAMLKRKEVHITSLEESLAQKTKANEELTAICDELINKVG